MGYSIKVLDNQEFEDLPYSKVGTSLGVADPETNTAYIRETGIHELNRYLIDHEFEHLIEEVPTDEFEGVRYKDLGSFFGGGGGTATAGTAAKGATSGMGGMSSMIGPMMGMFGSSLIPNPTAPKLPDSFNKFAEMAQSGGPQISQTGSSAVSGVLNTPYEQVSGDEQDAALHGLNLQKEQETRQLQALYKNARPGTDYLTDSAYQRDSGQLNDRYARAQAETLSQLQRSSRTNYNNQQFQGAQVAGGLGQNQMNNMMNQFQTEYFPALQNYSSSLQKRQDLRSNLMNMFQLPMQMQMFKSMMGK